MTETGKTFSEFPFRHANGGVKEAVFAGRNAIFVHIRVFFGKKPVLDIASMKKWIRLPDEVLNIGIGRRE